ncbi:MAG: succinylglutamate desuccinylase/aspartoacylase family protein [Alphaproteobacteria bacterium]
MTPPVSRIRTAIDFEKNGKQVGDLHVPSSTNESAYGVVAVPITVIKNGKGPTIFFTGGVHGDEYEGQVALMKLARRLKVGQIQGRVIIIPALNLPAAEAGARCSPLDGLNMNRIFPGSMEGSITLQIAHYVSNVILPMVDVQIDMHSGGKTLEYIPTIIMNRSKDKKREARTREALMAFGMPIGLYDVKTDHGGLFEMECEARGILAINAELGGAGRVDLNTLHMAEHAVDNMLKFFGLMKGKIVTPKMQGRAPTRLMEVNDPRANIYCPDRGLFEPFVDLGAEVKAGQALGQVHFPGNSAREPWTVMGRLKGLVILKRPPGRVERGDVVFQIATDKKG